MSRLITSGTAGFSDDYYDVPLGGAVALPSVRERKYVEYIVMQPANQPSISFYRPKTELSRRLWELRMQRIAAGEPLLSAEEIEREIQERRGEQHNERP